MILLGLAILLVAISGLPGVFLRTRGAGVATVLLGLGAGLGLIPAVAVLAGWGPLHAAMPATPLGGLGALRLDPIAALFLVPVLLLPACGSLFGLGYWPDSHENAARLRLLYGLTTASLALLVAAAHALTFLLAWEGMAVTACFLVLSEDRDPATLRAGWIYLAATHTGTLCLIGAFALLAGATGGYLLTGLPLGFAASQPGSASFLLFLAGFGLKAGVMPLHFWLPVAHAAAPSHVSAFMSGIFIKMGILGLVRVLALTPDPPLWWGATLIGLGALSGVLGVAYALGQHDLKRLLAYHSIENIGIILLGLGLGTLGKTLGNPALVLLGFAGGLMHVLNHSLFKGLLFLGAGSVIRATGSRELEHLGGLARRMPWTAGTFLVGSWAICGLPPLNGFASEWLIYMAAFRALALPHSTWAALALAALALIGALALACFAKVYAAVFLGRARSAGAETALEAPRSMLAPMVLLAGLCAVVGLAPALLAPALARVAAQVAGTPLPALASLAQLARFSWLALPLLAAALALGRWALAAGPGRAGLPTWDCGYAGAAPRAQYSASSFAAGLVSGMDFVLLPVVQGRRVSGLFPGPRRFESHVPDGILDRLAGPGLAALARGLTFLRVLQGGQLPLYLLYILLTLLAIFWMVA